MELLKHSLSSSLGILISRILGFVRDASIAYVFGASYITDAFFIAFRLPNTFRRIFGEGGFNPAFVPMYAKALKENRAREFLGKLFTLYILSVIIVTILGTLFARQIIYLIAPGVRDSLTFELSVYMAQFLFSYLVFVALSSFFMGILNTHGSFFIPMFAQALFNLCFTLTLLIAGDGMGYDSLILGVLLGGMAQVLVNLPFLAKAGVGLKPALRIDSEIIQFLKRLLPSVGSFGVGQLSLFIDTFLASFLGKGVISYLYYANRLFLLPMSLISTSVANVLLTLLSRKGEGKRDTELSVRVILLLTLPACAGLISISEDIVRVVYERGSFTRADALITASLLSIYSLSLPFFSLSKIVSSRLFSKGDTLTPMKGSLITVLSEGVLAAVLAFALGLGIWGLPLGTFLSSLIGFLYLQSRERGFKAPLFDARDTLLKALLSSVVMGLVLRLLSRELDMNIYVKTSALIFMGATLYFALNVFLRERLTLGLLQGFVKKLSNP
jgi:putative peptidoglycan lipid II flippase